MQTGNIEQNSIIIRNEAKKHQRYAGIIGFMKGFIMTACLIGLYPLTIYIVISTGNLFGPTPTYFPLIILLLIYLAYFLIPFLVCAPVALLLSLKQQNAARILVFRKFNNKASRKALSSVIRTGLSKYGHTFTLADSNFKVPWYVRIPFIQGQLSLFHFRQIIINKKSRLDDFKKSIQQQSWLNINWLLSADKVFAVRTSDEFWQQTAGNLLISSDLVLFDVSTESKYMPWEMEQSIKHNLGQKIIAICSGKNRTAVQEWMEKFKESFPAPVPLFFYNDKGALINKKGFDDSVVAILAQSYQQEKTTEAAEWEEREAPVDKALLQQSDSAIAMPPKQPVAKDTVGGYAIRRTIKLSVITAAVIAGILFFVSPHLSPAFTAGHSPFPGQAVAAFVQCAKTKIDSNRLRGIGRSLHRSWPVTAAARSIDHALDHYADECEAVQYVLESLADYSQHQQYGKLVTDAEPSVAAAAARALSVMYNPDGARLSFSLELLKSPCLDTRLNALIILQHLSFTAAAADTMLNSALIPAIYETYDTHKTSVAGLHRTESNHIPVNTQNEDDYYLQLFQLVKLYIEPRHLGQLQTLFASSHLRTRIFAAMLLAKLNDARGLPLLIEALAIKKIAHKKIVILDVPFTSFPYEHEIDGLMQDLKKPDNIPPVDSFLLRLAYPNNMVFSDTVKKNHALINLVVFAAQELNAEQALRVIKRIPSDAPRQLGDALDSLYEMDNSEMKKRVLQFVRAQQPLLADNLYNHKIPVRLQSARLLALTGYGYIVKPLLETANIVPLSSLFSKYKEHPHAAAAGLILETLSANLETGCNTSAWVTLKETAQPELQPVLTKLIRQCKGR